MVHRFLRFILANTFLAVAIPYSFAQPCADTQPVITGPGVVSNNQLGVIYNTPNIPGHTYSWLVTGGTIGSGAGTNQITVNWGNVGTGTISLTETNSALGCNATVNKSVAVQPLLISYLYYTNTSCYGDVVSFWDASVYDPANPIISYWWDFGDGGTSTLQNPTHQYLPPYNVTYTITLIVTNQGGMKDTIYDAVYVNPNQFIPTAIYSSAIPPCSYQPVQFNSTASTTPPLTGNIIHWDWNFGDPGSGTNNTSNLQNPAHVFTGPGTYTVSLEITNERYCKDDTTMTVTILPSVPTAQYTFSAPTCLNNPVYFTNQSTFPAGRDIVTWIWNFGDGSTPVTINAPASPDVSHVFPGLGPYQVRLTVVNNITCRDSILKPVALDPSPIADFNYDAACMGDSVKFHNLTILNNGPMIASYYWDFDDPGSGFNTSTAKNPSHLFSGIGIYNVMLISVNTSGCPDTVWHTVQVFPAPPVEFSWHYGTQNNAIQFHLDSTIVPIGMVGNMVHWNFGDGSYANGDYNPVHIYPDANTYTVTLTVTDTIGCSNSISHQVGVPSVPVAFFSSNSPVCDGQPVCFTDYSSVPSPPFGYITTWIWDFGDGTPQDTIYFPTVPNVCHTYATIDTFTVTLKVIDNSYYTDEYSADVYILPNPVPNFDFTVGCEDQIVQFTDLSFANGGGNIISWDWNFGDPGSGINNTSGLQNPTHIFANGDSTYNVRLIIINFNNCTDTIVKQVYILPHPPVNFTHDSACINSIVHYWADTVTTNIGAVATWSWNFGDGTPLVTDPINTAHLYTAPGVYTTTLIITDTNGCMNTISHNVYVNPLPVPNFTWTSPVCQNTMVSFFDQSFTPPGYTGYVSKWIWNFGDGTSDTIVLPSSPNVQHLYTGTGVSFPVTLTIWSNHGCTDSITKIVNLTPAPIANFDYSTVNCQGQAVNFTDLTQTNGGGNLVFWNWNFDDPGSGINNSSSLQNPTHIYADTGTYHVRLITMNVNNCVDTVFKDVIIGLKPMAWFVADTACFGSPTQFADSSLANASSIISYTWNFGDGSPLLMNQPNPTHTYQTYGIFNVTLSIVNSNGCTKDTTEQVLVNPLPLPAFSWSSPTCQGAPVQYTDLSTTVTGYLGQIVRWIWDFGDGQGANILFPNDPNVSHVFAGIGQFHTVRLTIKTSDSCEAYVEHVVSSVPAPIANFSAPNGNCTDQLVPFTDLSQPNGGGNITQWLWDFDDPGSGINNGSTAQNPSHAFSTSGTFDVVLIVWNASNCTDTITHQVIIADPPAAAFVADTACLGSLTHFNSSGSTGSITGYYWQFGDGGTSTAQNPSYQYSAAQVYTVTLTVSTATGCTNTISHQVLVIPKPAAAFTFQSPACAQDSVQFTNLSNTTYGYITTWVWDFGDGTTPVTINFPSSPDVTHLFTTGGTYNVSLTITTSTSCTDTKVNQVTIVNPPLANFSFPSTRCALMPVSFTDQSQQNGGGGIVSWAWDFDDPGSGTNNNSNVQNPSHTFSTNGTFNVNLIVINANGCQDSVTKQVSIQEAPVAAFTADTACFGMPTQFTDASTTPSGTITSWIWDFGDPASGGNNTSNMQNPVHVFSSIGTYTVTLEVTNSNGCVRDTSMNVGVNPSPTALFEYTPACVNSATQFTDLSIAPGSSIIGWLWDFGDGSGTSTDQNPTYTYTTAGTYNVKLTVTNLSNCNDSIVIPVVARPTPVAAFTYQGFYCPAGQVNFQDESQGVGAAIVDHLWIFEPGYTSNLVNPTHVFSVTDSTYAVTLIVTDNYGCQDTIIDSVYVKPGMAFTFNYDTVCFGYPMHFNAVNLAQGDSLYSVIWNFGDPASGPQNTSYLYNPTHNFTAPGNYVVKLKAWNSDNCIDSLYQQVTVFNLPAPDFSVVSVPCDSNLLFSDLTDPGIGNIATWEWHFGDGTPPVIITGLSSGDTSHIYSLIGQYTVTLITTNSRGCQDSITKVVERYPCIQAAYVPPVNNCANNLIAFADSSKPVSRISQWAWYFDDGQDTTYTTFTPQVTHTFAAGGTYNVKLVINATVSGVQFADSTTQTVTVNPTPDALFASPNTCHNLPTVFSDTSDTFGEPNTTWSWHFGDPSSGVNDTSTLSNPSHLYGSAGFYDVQMIVSNKFGCTDSLTKQVQIFSLPVAKFTNSVACDGDPTYFTDATSLADTTISAWNWNFGVPNLVLDTSTLENPAYTYPAIGSYTVRMIVQDYNGCRDTVDSTVLVNSTPISSFTFIDNVDGMTGKIQLQNTSTDATGYFWDFGNGRTSEDENPTVTYAEDGTYTIQLISTNEYNCQDTTYYKYEVLFKGLYIPNAFAPTSANLGVLLFKPVGINLMKYHIMVFDRFGRMMWESTALDSQGRPVEGWDGYYQGALQPQGTYMWKCEATFIDDSPWNGSSIGKGEASTTGSVSLIR